MRPLPVGDLKTYASVLSHQAELIRANGDFTVPVMSRLDKETAKNGVLPQDFSLLPGLDLEETLGRAGLNRLTAALRELTRLARLNCLEESPQRASTSLVCVVENDPAALVGVALAGFSDRDFMVIGEPDLCEKETWELDSAFTLVFSIDLVSYNLLEILTGMAAKKGISEMAALPAIMTGTSLETISKIAFRSLAFRPVEQPVGGKSVLLLGPGPVPFPEVAGWDTLANPSKKDLYATFIKPGTHYPAVSFSNHGREYCGRLGEAALCARGEAGQPHKECLNGMVCFDQDWLRLTPSRIRADLVFVNSCSVFKSDKTFYNYERTLGLDFLEGPAHALIASYLVEYANPFDNYLFHSLANAGFTLAEITFLLNNASAGKRRLLAIGDADFRLARPAVKQFPLKAGLLESAKNTWQIVSLDGQVEQGQPVLLSLDSPEIYELATQREILMFKAGSNGQAESIGAIFPGFYAPQTFIYYVGEETLAELRLVKRDYKTIESFNRSLEKLALRMAQVKSFYNLEHNPLVSLDAELPGIIKIFQAIWSPLRRHLIPLEQARLGEQLLEQFEEQANLVLVKELSKDHCGEAVLSDLLIERQSGPGKACFYCGQQVVTTTSTSFTWPYFTSISEICPLCGIVSIRTGGTLEIRVISEDSYRRACADYFIICGEVINRGSTPASGYLAFTLIPKVPSAPSPAITLPQPFRVEPGASQMVQFKVKVPAEFPANIYVAQLSGAHIDGVDYACRYIRLI